MRFIALAAVLLMASAAAVCALALPAASPSALVLSERDVGPAYAPNRAFTTSRTLAEVSTGAPAPIKRALERLWLAGAQSGFDGRAAARRQSILSTADLFRSTAVRRVMGWWEARYLALSHGSRIAVPASAPGADRFLLRGRMRSSEVLISLWRHGRAVLSTWLIGAPGTLRSSLLVQTARRQDAKATSAFGR